MRSASDRVRHAVLFEALGLAIFIPLFTFLLGMEASHMGVVGVMSATLAMCWNFIFNLGFDKLMWRLVGRLDKAIWLRVVHACLFEAGLAVILVPPIAWYLGMSLWNTLLMDVSIIVFYLVYAFFYNLAYDRIFPVPFEAARGA